MENVKMGISTTYTNETNVSASVNTGNSGFNLAPGGSFVQDGPVKVEIRANAPERAGDEPREPVTGRLKAEVYNGTDQTVFVDGDFEGDGGKDPVAPGETGTFLSKVGAKDAKLFINPHF